MPSWNIDKAILRLESALFPGRVSGTSMTRALLDHRLFAEKGLKLPKDPEELAMQSTLVWCLGIGTLVEKKAFFYGLTMRAAYLKARKHFRKELQPRKNSYKKAKARKKL